MSGEIEYQAVLPAPPFAVPSWLRPLPACDGSLALAGTDARFGELDVIQRTENGLAACRMTVDAMMQSADDRNAASRSLDNISGQRPVFSGLSLARPQLMGILNTTPDSFSDGGQHHAPARAIAAGKSMLEAGASIVDIGGESTRPGATPITRNQELARVLPPLVGLKATEAVLSIDTRHAEVMERAASAGATIINDVAGLREPGALQAAAKSGCDVVIMHMQGDPQTMQSDPQYAFAPLDIYEFLEARIDEAVRAGISRDKICVDPGFGFGKTLRHNVQLVNWLAMLHGLGVPILFGASRKSSIAKMSRDEPADQRLSGSLVLAMAAVRQGAHILRVHDVAETAQALAVEQHLLAGAQDQG